MSFTSADNVDNIYYDIVLNNPSSTQDYPAIINQSRSTAIIDNPSEYYLSVVRFLIPLQSIPIFNFKADTYSVTLEFNGVPYQAPVLYIPSQTYHTVVPPYLPVYSYELFVVMINTALDAAYTLYKTANPGQPQTAPPYMVFNTHTQTTAIRAQSAYYNPSFDIATQPLKLFFNTALYTFFTSYIQLFNGYTRNGTPTAGRNFNIVIYDKGDNNEVIPASYNGGVTGPGFDMEQEFGTLYNWNDLRTIQIVSNTLKTRTEGISSINVDSTPTRNANGDIVNTSSESQPIITDFIPAIEIGPEGRSYVLYVPTAEYRLVDMVGTTPLKEINLQIKWTDKQGNVHPLFIPPNDSASIKILFRRRGYILNNMEKIGKEQLNIEKGILMKK